MDEILNLIESVSEGFPTYSYIKVVICGQYKNLNSITKNLRHLPEISQTSYFHYSQQITMQNRGTCCLKRVLIRKDQREFLCAKILRNSIVNENALNSEGSFMHYKVCPSNYS